MDEATLPRSLQPELLLQIFLKLPIRYVIRCKAVSKQWHCIISSPVFTSNFDLITQPPALMVFPPPSTSPALALSSEIDGSDDLVGQPWHLPYNNQVTILGSYNGLVALHQSAPSFESFCLFNPITKEEKLVRLPYTNEYYLYFGRSFSKNITGLCHDLTSDEYKVVITQPEALHPILLVSFKDSTFETESKRSCYQVQLRIGMTFKGSPHWLAYNGRGGSIIYFDLPTKEQRVIELPKGVETEEWGWYDNTNMSFVTKEAPACGFGALDGQLMVALKTEREEEEGRHEVWVLKEYGNEDSWTLLFVMCVDKIGPFRLLSWRKDEWVVLMFDEENMQRELEVYDVKLRSSYPLQLNRRISLSPTHKMVTYFPSFVSPIYH